MVTFWKKSNQLHDVQGNVMVWIWKTVLCEVIGKCENEYHFFQISSACYERVDAVIIVLVYYGKDACIHQVLHHRSDSVLADLISSLNEYNLIASLLLLLCQQKHSLLWMKILPNKDL
jgi:hypothetical protein